MFFAPLLTVLFVFTAVRASALLGNLTAVVPSPKLVPLAPMGNVAAVQIPNGDTRVFFQDATGNIVIARVTQPLLSGGTYIPIESVVPAREVLPSTPIVAIAANTATWTAMRIYFLSPANVLSEFTWVPGGFSGGPSCATCLTAQGIVVANSKVLYAMANTAFNQFRVGFVSAGQPTTISEAENLAGSWGVATYV
ncbi:hypothetical protein C8F04DRAFT_1238657 [Mycena alexandri]|uniref:Uncharacterized protein n=1 Tax=Mycena alexandri TaxID=1745969 RepID=A0AAD6SFQ7_9AGAR|nr:hypothetical protein C8F04DRAFT_1238657 [Mycena alexandri]